MGTHPGSQSVEAPEPGFEPAALFTRSRNSSSSFPLRANSLAPSAHPPPKSRPPPFLPFRPPSAARPKSRDHCPPAPPATGGSGCGTHLLGQVAGRQGQTGEAQVPVCIWPSAPLTDRACWDGKRVAAQVPNLPPRRVGAPFLEGGLRRILRLRRARAYLFLRNDGQRHLRRRPGVSLLTGNDAPSPGPG